MKKYKYETREDIKEHLRDGDYQLISEVLKGEYTPGTIKQQLNGYRTLKAPVIEAANKLIDLRNQLIAQ